MGRVGQSLIPQKWSMRLASDSSLLLEVAAEPSPATSSQVMALLRHLESLQTQIEAIENLHPAYRSILIDFDPIKVNPTELQGEVRSLLAEFVSEKTSEGRLIEVPVEYGGENGPDLSEVARHAGLSEDEVIRLHSEATYVVAFLGFAPGFPYFVGLPSSLACPRKKTPRLRVPAGSVAIGGEQAGIYPAESAGGWQIIGRTPLVLFDPEKESPALFAPGDRVVFLPVDSRGAK